VQTDRVPDATSAYDDVRTRCPVAGIDGVLGGYWAVLGHDDLVQVPLRLS
jgi:hypothetical protein